MRQRCYLVVSGVAVLLCLLEPTDADAEQPNVLFIICDDLNCDLACYGHAQVKSPNLDALARRGVRFSRAHCQYPLCGPSRASFMTGLYPDQTLIRRNTIYVREHLPNVRTVSQSFRRAGYFATRIGKIYHYNVPKHIGTSGHDDPYSWNYTINPRGRDVDDQPLIFSLRKGSFGGTLSWLAAEGTDQEQTDGIAADHAVDLLKQHARDKKRFFLALGLYRPHTPYVAPKKYFDLYPLDKIVVPKVPKGYLTTLPAPAQRSLTRKKEQVNLPHELARKAIQAYYASITFADAQIGRVLAALSESGLEENTVVVFTSDHGYHMGEHGYWQKTTLFENATRIPLIVAGPHVMARGAVAKQPVEMVDLYPTLAELCQVAAPNYLSGVSLAPALKDPQAVCREDAFTQYATGYSLRTSRFRYTQWGPSGTGGTELYDHRSDPRELKNLAEDGGYADTIKRLKVRLEKRIEQARKKPAGVTQIRFQNRRRVR